MEAEEDRAKEAASEKKKEEKKKKKGEGKKKKKWNELKVCMVYNIDAEYH